MIGGGDEMATKRSKGRRGKEQPTTEASQRAAAYPLLDEAVTPPRGWSLEFKSAGVAGLNDVKRVELVEIVAVKWEKSNLRLSTFGVRRPSGSGKRDPC